MRHVQVSRLVLGASIAALIALALMVSSILSPQPILIVLAMSLGQLFGTLSLAAYLLAIVLDLQGGGGEPRAPSGGDRPGAQQPARPGSE